MSTRPGMEGGPEKTVRRRRGLFFIDALLSLLSGCVAIPKSPIPALEYRTNSSQRQPNLLVLLRGLGAGNTIFEKEGIVDEVRRRNLPFDIVAPNTHWGYYREQTLEVRLKQDIIDPARHAGYRHIWLAGFSLGGMGSLLYLRSHPGDIDGVLLVSPFLGRGAFLDEIRDAGGVAAWDPASGNQENKERELWRWIKQHDFNSSPPVWLGYGRDDWIVVQGATLLAGMLPYEHSFFIPGSHDIDTLKKIFQHQLDLLAEQHADIQD